MSIDTCCEDIVSDLYSISFICYYLYGLNNPCSYTFQNLGIYSGAIFFKEFKLIVLSPPPGIIDVLSMGSYSPTKEDMTYNSSLYKVTGAYHSVFSNRFANQLYKTNGKLSFFHTTHH